MRAVQRFDFIARTGIITGEKPTKPVEARESANAHQMHRVVGYLPDGQRVAVAQRPGKGGMEFTKLMSGKVYAVAADGMSPVFEKVDGKPTNVQKIEDGLPLYSASGFYLLSSRDYPALRIMRAFTRLDDTAERVQLITAQQMGARRTMEIRDREGLSLLLGALAAELADERNLVAGFDAAINRKRKRAIEQAQEEAEDDDEKYQGAAFKELAASEKDGNPFVLLSWRAEGQTATHTDAVERQAIDDNGGERLSHSYFTAREAVQRFAQMDGFRRMRAAVAAGQTVRVGFVQGNVMRASVVFRRKCEELIASATRELYGDAPYIYSALTDWTRAIVTLMHSRHPSFPQLDYDAHYYVAACRQLEVGMNRRAGRWSPPQCPSYDLPKALLAAAAAAAPSRVDAPGERIAA